MAAVARRDDVVLVRRATEVDRAQERRAVLEPADDERVPERVELVPALVEHRAEVRVDLGGAVLEAVVAVRVRLREPLQLVQERVVVRELARRADQRVRARARDARHVFEHGERPVRRERVGREHHAVLVLRAR